MKAIILAGGLGTRLRPLTSTCPKPLLPIGNLPIVARIILALRRQNIREFTFLLHYKPEQFIETLGKGEAFDAVFHYECLERDLSTAGSVKFIADKITETSLVFSADILAEVPVAEMLAFHESRKALVTIALHPMPAPLPFGIVLRQPDGRIKRFLEKPTWPQVYSDWINSAVYIIAPELLRHIPNHGAPSFFEKEVFPPLAKKGEAIYGFPLSGYWRDVGTPEDLRHANLDLLHGHLPPIMLTEEEQRAARQTFLAGEASSIAAGATIQNSVLGKNCRIKAGAKIFNSVLGDQVRVKSNAQINGAIVMNDVHLGERVTLEEDSLIGAGAKLNEGVIVQKNATVRQYRKLAPRKIITALKVLPSGYLRRFVDGGSLLGSSLKNFSCDFMRWVSRAFGQYLLALLAEKKEPRRSTPKFLLATASAETLEFWRDALAQGLTATGSAIHIVNDITLPVMRHTLRQQEYSGGIFLSVDDYSGLMRIVLLHGSGENFSTSEACALERIDSFEESRTGEVVHLNEESNCEAYLDDLLKRLDFEAESSTLPPITLGIVGAATEKMVKRLLKRRNWSAEVITLPIEVETDLRERALALQEQLLTRAQNDSHFTFWIGSAGERFRLLLPEAPLPQFGAGDFALARLLARTKEPIRQLLAGWLMPEILPKRALGPKHNATQISGMNSSMAALAREQGYDLWYGFDGNGGITISEWMPYHDAVMAFATLAPHLAEESYQHCMSTARSLANHYALIPCADEAKAQVMRRLIETFAELRSEVSDGVKFELPEGWVLVRACAGREAVEAFKYEKRGPAGNTMTEKIYSRMLEALKGWTKEAQEDY